MRRTTARSADSCGKISRRQAVSAYETATIASRLVPIHHGAPSAAFKRIPDPSDAPARLFSSAATPSPTEGLCQCNESRSSRSDFPERKCTQAFQPSTWLPTRSLSAGEGARYMPRLVCTPPFAVTVAFKVWPLRTRLCRSSSPGASRPASMSCTSRPGRPASVLCVNEPVDSADPPAVRELPLATNELGLVPPVSNNRRSTSLGCSKSRLCCTSTLNTSSSITIVCFISSLQSKTCSRHELRALSHPGPAGYDAIQSPEKASALPEAAQTKASTLHCTTVRLRRLTG